MALSRAPETLLPRAIKEKTMALRELAEREADGIVVRLFWDDELATGADVIVTYRDERRNQSYFLHPPRANALDAFYHPNAYVALDPEAFPVAA
jgi:hypothetical protein